MKVATRAGGSVLVSVLWCLALLSILVLGVLHTTRLDLAITKNQADSVQAYYLALAGAEKAKALIFHDAASRKKAAVNHSGELYDAPKHFREIEFGRGTYSVLREAPPEAGGGLVYGISDEEGRLNINLVEMEELLKLERMLPEIAAAIIDWRDRDDNVTPNGAEVEYYSSLNPPYLPRNERIQTARELLQVRGVSSLLLLGEDANANGILDPEEDDGSVSDPPDNGDGYLGTGWAGSLSFDTQVRNENAAGETRVNVQDADEAALRTVRGISPELAKAIIAYRDQNRIENLDDLLEVAAIAPPSAQPGANQPVRAGVPGSENPGRAAPGPRAQTTGPKLISQEMLLEMGDDITTSGEVAQRNAININSAGFDVLRCLPGMTDELAQAVINYRSSAGYFPNIAHLLRVPGVTRQIFRQVSPRLSARSETFRIISEGRVTSSGARRRLEMTVRLGRSSTLDTISYRELL